MTPTDPARDRRTLALWLLIVAAMIFFMVVLGGTTRLTRSGLSIVEWRLLEGTLPPLSEAHWLELFDKYQTHARIPEGQCRHGPDGLQGNLLA